MKDEVDLTDFHAVKAALEDNRCKAYWLAAAILCLAGIVWAVTKNYIAAWVVLFTLWAIATFKVNARESFLKESAGMTCRRCGASLFTFWGGYNPVKHCQKCGRATPEADTYAKELT